MRIFGYGRVSTTDQENSSENQEHKLREYIASTGMPLGGIFLDDGVSGSKIKLQNRKAGKLLWDQLRPGDMVVITKLDRVFRNLLDAVTTISRWRELGCKVKFLDMNIDLGTPEGQAMFSMLATFAQYESSMIGSRQRDIWAYMKRSGIAYGRVRPLGWIKKDRGFVPCDRERKLGAYVTEERLSGKSWVAIATDVCQRGIMKPQAARGIRGWYGEKDIRRLFAAASAGFPEVPQVALQDGSSESKRSESESRTSPKEI